MHIKKIIFSSFIVLSIGLPVLAMDMNKTLGNSVASAKIAPKILAPAPPSSYLSLQKLWRTASFDPGRKLHEGVKFQKSSSTVPGYPGGIYYFEVNGAKKEHLLFGTSQVYDWLHRTRKDSEKAFFYINFIGPYEKCEITLPTMDGIVAGNNFFKSSFFIGSSKVENNNSYYFKDKQKHPALIRARGHIYAAQKSDFIIGNGSSTALINHLFTDNLHKFLLDHTKLDDEIDYRDNHFRKARPHQIEQIIGIIRAMDNGARHIAVEAATGSGKSYTQQRFAELIAPKKVLIVTSRENLVDQFVQSFKRDFKSLRVSSSDQSDEPLAKFLPAAIKANDVVITTLQGFQLNYEKSDLYSGIDVIMFDEAQNLLSANRLKMNNFLKNLNKFDIHYYTATPTRLLPNKESLLISVYNLSDEEVYGKHHVQALPLKEAIKIGVNTPFQLVHVSNLPLKLDAAGEDFNLLQAGVKLSNNKYHRVISDIYQNSVISNSALMGKYAIAFCASIEHAESLATYLNQTNEGIETHKREYEKALKNFLVPFIGKNSTRELKSLWQATYNKSNSQIRFFSEKISKKLENDFLAKFPYVFADSVHSGNSSYKINDNDMRLRLFRNMLGGSTILCGADKLTEGFDNPVIEVGFMLSPVRNSNIKAMQRFGRLLRTNKEQPGKIAVAFEFIWDERQLLLSSPELLGTMHFGLPEALGININKHLDDVLPYQLSTEQRTTGTVVVNKRKPHTAPSNEKPAKKVRKENNDENPEAMISELRNLITRLKNVSVGLQNYNLLMPPEEAIETETGPVQNICPMPSGFGLRAQNVKCSDKILCHDAREITSEVKDFFAESRPKKRHKAISDDNAKSCAKPQSNCDPESLKQLIARAKIALNAANRYMTHCQMDFSIDAFKHEVNQLLEDVSEVTSETVMSDPSSSLEAPLYNQSTSKPMIDDLDTPMPPHNEALKPRQLFKQHEVAFPPTPRSFLEEYELEQSALPYLNTTANGNGNIALELAAPDVLMNDHSRPNSLAIIPQTLSFSIKDWREIYNKTHNPEVRESITTINLDFRWGVWEEDFPHFMKMLKGFSNLKNLYIKDLLFLCNINSQQSWMFTEILSLPNLESFKCDDGLKHNEILPLVKGIREAKSLRNLRRMEMHFHTVDTEGSRKLVAAMERKGFKAEKVNYGYIFTPANSDDR